MAGASTLIKEANKLTFAQPTVVKTPHVVKAVLENKRHLWLTNPHMFQYQSLLTHNPQVTTEQSNTLKLATLLPKPEANRRLEHECLSVIEQTYSSRPDLKDVPLQNPDVVWHTDGSSFLEDSVRKAGYAVVSQEKVIESEP